MEGKMTTIYFVRHAEPNYDNHDDLSRELSNKGLQDRKLVKKFLLDKRIDAALSSPYKRAVDTIADFAESVNLEIEIIDDFRERKIGNEWIDDFNTFSRKQWENFDYKLTDGESLNEVQSRNIRALGEVLTGFKGKNVVIGSHGTALSTVINYYDKTFGFSDFERIKNLMPWIVEFVFEDNTCMKIRSYNLYEIETDGVLQFV
jgi:2,3-bisphosphoglycerate-dependent phosphoglycerate mutase